MGSFYMEATQINYRRDETLKTVDQKLQELSEESAVDTDIAPVFSKTATYNPGDLVYYKNKLYVCNTQHTGAWAAGDFTATTVSGRITASDEAKADNIDLAPAFNSESSYAAGDLVTYNGTVYRCTNDHTGAWDAGDFSATTISAELSSLKSGLTNVDVALSVPENSGKNIITMTLSEIKSLNTSGTWADNVYTLGGLTFTVLTDSDGKVIGVKANGTAPSGDVYFTLGNISFVKDVSYRMTSGTTGSTAETYRIWAYSSTAFPVGHRLSTDSNCGENVARDALANEICPIAFMIMSGYAPNNVTVYPMVRLASVSDPTFAPYIPSVESRIEAVESETTNTYDFSTPSGYNAGGRIIIDKKGKVVILRFIDYVPTCPSGKVELLSGLPAATNGQSTQFYNPVSNVFFKPLIDTDGKLYSYYTGDLTSNTAPFTGQLVYFTN